MKSTIRKASSLLLVAKTAFVPSTTLNGAVDFNYKLLSMKRSQTSSFMPNANVFPGGNICEADKSSDWLDLYKRFGFSRDSFEKLNYNPLVPENNCDMLPPFLWLRIGAIRETFEECGILICRSYKINYKERIARWASFIDTVDIKKWQDLVHNQPERFLEMCDTLEIYPDVWALKAWSNWITPAFQSKRYDTMFFLASFHQIPPSYAEDKEVQHLEWSTPKEYILRNYHNEIALPPPQVYEISRLGNFRDVDLLTKFASDRAGCGVETFLPVHCKSREGSFILLPGDDLYPKDPESVAVLEFDTLPDCHVQNRLRTKNLFNGSLIMRNYAPKFNHIAPIDLTASKL